MFVQNILSHKDTYITYFVIVFFSRTTNVGFHFIPLIYATLDLLLTSILQDAFSANVAQH